MPARLDESRATLIANAIRNDGTFCGTAEWLDTHHIGREEFEAFLDYPTRLARMYEWRETNMTVGSVEVSLTFTKHSGKVGSEEESWQVFAPQSETAKILRVAETGRVIAQLTPEQMPLPFDDTVGMFDKVTGEVL